MPLVEAIEVSRVFTRPDGSLLRAVDRVTLQVHKGSTLAIIGESGSGKSTFARILIGLQRPDEGRVLFDGTDITTLKAGAMRKLRSRIGMVFQEPYESLNPRRRIGSIIEEPLVIHRRDMTRDERRQRVAHMLREVELDPVVADRYPAALSGGQQQRIGIARALIGNPELVVLDEPTSSLDLSVRAQILILLARLQRAHGLTYLMITHDISSVEYFADEVAVMYRGAVVERGPTADVLTRPRESYTEQLLSARLLV